MKDTPTLVRQWQLLHALQARLQGATLEELASESGVSQRSIQRDLRFFSEVGIPLQCQRGPNGRKLWQISPDHPLTRLSFNLTEAASLCLGFRLLEPLAGTYLWDGAQSALKKIRSCLSAEALRYFSTFGEAFFPTHFGTGDYSQHAQILDALMLGIEERRYTSLTYQSQQTTEPYTRDVYPHALAYHKGTLYLVAWAPERNGFRNYKVDRITDALALELRFTRDPSFNIEEYLVGTFGIYQGTGEPQRVRVHFAASVARYVAEKDWHHTQTLHRQRDGSLIAEFHLANFNELASWVLSFGREAEILEPHSLRAEIAATIRAMGEIYDNAVPLSRNGQASRKRTPK